METKISCPVCHEDMDESFASHMKCPACGRYINVALLSFYKEKDDESSTVDEHVTNPGVGSKL